MRIGQPAIIKVDALPGVEFHGHVESLSPGTGAQFSLLPPQNATGNFTKIVQRVPVRVAIDATPEETRAFVAGLSVTVEVNTIAPRMNCARCASATAKQRHPQGAAVSSAARQAAGQGAQPEKADAAAWLAVAAGTLGALMATLDISIVNSSLPTIQGEIGASGTEGTWIATAYLVAEIVIIPMSAWLERLLGLRVLLLTAASLFTCSRCCAACRPRCR
jgi:hypothetical protein